MIKFRSLFHAGRGMKTRLVLKPGPKGTKRLLEKYGDALVCVRFRCDAESQQRLKTIKLIVDRIDWTPPPPRYPADTIVPLHIVATDLCDPEKKLWFVKYSQIAGTPLERHIHVDNT